MLLSQSTGPQLPKTEKPTAAELRHDDYAIIMIKIVNPQELRAPRLPVLTSHAYISGAVKATPAPSPITSRPTNMDPKPLLKASISVPTTLTKLPPIRDACAPGTGAGGDNGLKREPKSWNILIAKKEAELLDSDRADRWELSVRAATKHDGSRGTQHTTRNKQVLSTSHLESIARLVALVWGIFEATRQPAPPAKVNAEGMDRLSFCFAPCDRRRPTRAPRACTRGRQRG